MKSIIITGASSGVGAATAEAFLAAGWRVGLVARSADRLEAMADGRAGAVPLVADVADADALEAAVARFCEAGPLDAAFCNAGIFSPSAPIDEIALDDWRRALDVNLTGVFLTARAAFGRMRRQDPQGGRIILNGSISAHAPRPGSVCYTATKHAITGLTKTLALDGRAFNIAAGQIDIGNADTPMVAAMKQGVPQADGSRRAEPVMDVAHVAEAVLRMAELPLSANVLSMTLMASAMPFVGRG